MPNTKENPWSTKSNSEITFRLVKVNGDEATGLRGRPAISLDAVKARLLKLKTDSQGRYNASKARNVKVQKLKKGIVQELLELHAPRK